MADLLTLSTDMLALRTQFNQFPSIHMPRDYAGMTYDTDTRKITGQALRNLRKVRSLSLDTIGKHLGLTKQSLSKWETSDTHLTDDQIKRFLSAISATEDDLNTELARIAATQGTVIDIASTPWYKSYPERLGIMVLNCDDLAPWAERGERVLYEYDRSPKRSEACILDLKDGQSLPRFYEKSENGRAYFRKNNPDELESYLWDQVAGIHKITLRGD